MFWGGTSVLVGKHFQLENSIFSRELRLILSHIIYLNQRDEKKKLASSCSECLFEGFCPWGRVPVFLIKISFFLSKLCDVAHLGMLIRDVIRRKPCHVDGPSWLLLWPHLTIGHV